MDHPEWGCAVLSRYPNIGQVQPALICQVLLGQTLQGRSASVSINSRTCRRQGPVLRTSRKSIEQAQRFLTIHGQVQNLFRVGRNHLKQFIIVFSVIERSPTGER